MKILFSVSTTPISNGWIAWNNKSKNINLFTPSELDSVTVEGYQGLGYITNIIARNAIRVRLEGGERVEVSMDKLRPSKVKFNFGAM